MRRLERKRLDCAFLANEGWCFGKLPRYFAKSSEWEFRLLRLSQLKSELYGKKSVCLQRTSATGNTSPVVRYVYRWGPLWATSAFQFENYNCVLVKFIHGSKNPAKKLCTKLWIDHGLKILQSDIHGVNRLDTAIGYTIELKDKSRNCSATMLAKTSLHHDLFEICMRYSIVNKDLTSSIYLRVKSCNIYTEFLESNSSRGYREIKCFVKTEHCKYT